MTAMDIIQPLCIVVGVIVAVAVVYFIGTAIKGRLSERKRHPGRGASGGSHRRQG